MDETDAKKQHRKRQSGPKAAKKNSKKKLSDQNETSEETSKTDKPRSLEDDRRRNPKAFSYQSVNKVSRAVRRYEDIVKFS